MKRIEHAFARLRQKEEKALMTYLPWSEGPIYSTRETLDIFVEAGVDLVEVSTPTRTPWMDGPTMQRNHYTSFSQALITDDLFEFLAYARSQYPELPIMPMAFVSAVYEYGPAKFFASCKQAGCDGVEIPDYPYLSNADRDGWYKSCREHGLDWVGFVDGIATAPEGSEEYQLLESLLKTCGGLLFILSKPGVTGAESGSIVTPHLIAAVKRLKDLTGELEVNLPLLVGFGLSTPASVREVFTHTEADAVVVGSAVSAYAQRGRSVREKLQFIKSLKAETRS